jgi:hypothetical protein
MNSNLNILSNNNTNHTDIKNKGFIILNEMFEANGWHLIKNEVNWISYTKFGDECSSFDIKISTDKIVVSVPIKNSPYQFVTSFKSYYDASEFIEQKFFDYINKKN